MRLFRRKTERAPAAACLVSLSPLQPTDNGSGVESSVGKSQSNDSIFKSSTSTRPQILHLNLRGTKNNKTTVALDGSPKSPVKKGFATWGRKMGKTWNQLKNANAGDLTSSVEVVDGTGKLRGSGNVTQKHWRLSLGTREAKEGHRERHHRKSEGNALSLDHHQQKDYGCNPPKNVNPKGDIDRYKAATANSSNSADASKTKSKGSNGRLYRKPSTSEENLGSLLNSKKVSSLPGDDEFYVNAKGCCVRKCATLKAPKSKAVDRVESIKGMILSRTSRSPARLNKRNESDAKDKKSHFQTRTDTNHLKNNSPLFRSCSTSTLPSYVAGDDPAEDLDFSPNLRHHQAKLHSYSSNKAKMIMLGASPCYYSIYSPSSPAGSPSKKAVSLDNIASIVGNDVTTPLSSNKKFGFPHGFVRSKLTVLPEESQHQHPSQPKLLVSSLSSDSVHLKVADSYCKQEFSSKTSLLNNKSNNNSSSKIISKTDQSPMSKGEAVLLKANLIKPIFCGIKGRRIHRSRSNSPVTGPTQAHQEYQAGGSRSSSVPKSSHPSSVKSVSNSCEMLDSFQQSLCNDENHELRAPQGKEFPTDLTNPNLNTESVNMNGSMGANVSANNFSKESTSITQGSGKNTENVSAKEQSNSCQFNPQDSCQSQNVSQPKASPSSLGSGTTAQVGSTYISSNESGYDSDSTKNVDEGSPNVNPNDSTESKAIDSNSEASNSPLQPESKDKTQLSEIHGSLVDDENEIHAGNKTGTGWELGHNAELKIAKSKAAVVRRKSDLANAVIARHNLISNSPGVGGCPECMMPSMPSYDHHHHSCRTNQIGNYADTYFPRPSPCPFTQMSLGPGSSTPASIGEGMSQNQSHFRTRKLGKVPYIPMESREIFRICTSSSAQSSYLLDKETFNPEPFTGPPAYGNLPPPPPHSASRKRFQLFHITKGPEEPLGITLLSCIGDCNNGIGTVEHQVKQIHPGSAVERDGRIEVGDEIVNINSQRIRGMSSQDAISVLNSAAFNCPQLDVLIARENRGVGCITRNTGASGSCDTSGAFLPTKFPLHGIKTMNQNPSQSFYRTNSEPGYESMKSDIGGMVSNCIKEEDETGSGVKTDSPMKSLLNELNQLSIPPYSYSNPATATAPFGVNGSSKSNQGFIDRHNMEAGCGSLYPRSPAINPSVSITTTYFNSPCKNNFLDAGAPKSMGAPMGNFQNFPSPMSNQHLQFSKKNRRHSTLTYYNADADAINSGYGPFPYPHDQAQADAQYNATTNYYLTTNLCTLPRKSKSKSNNPPPPLFKIHTVVFEKGPGKKTLGFSIVGGRDSPKGNLGIFVKTVFLDGQASEHNSLFEGDEILQVNDLSFQGFSHGEAIAVFKKIKTGSVTLHVLRRSGAGKPKSPKSKSCDDLESIESIINTKS